MGNCAENIVGQRFGRLTVIGRAPNKATGNSQWVCQCDCGNITVVKRTSLFNKTSQSCGCLRNETMKEKMTTHGLSQTKLYTVWEGIKRRCNNPDYCLYKGYGARGIRVCEAWLDFENFYDWAIRNGYKKGLSIERIDNNGNYEPSNCKWATKKEQARNRRSNKLITYKGETHCVYEWAEILGINKKTLSTRLFRGWEIEKAFNFNRAI